MKIVVFGGGMQGRVIAQNLLDRPENPEVLIADLRVPAALPKGARFSTCDVLNAGEVKGLLAGADAAVLAVPSEIARKALELLLATGVPVADVSFTPDPPVDLAPIAKKSGSCCVVDCGVAPGLSHLLVGHAYAELGGLDSARIMVGGMPQQPPAVFRHAVYFNPRDLVAEYVRPARARKDGQDIQPSPLDVPVQTFKDAELGELEMFLSDGLRSLLNSYKDVPNMSELTLRWHGHIDAMKTLRALGLLENEASRAVADMIGSRYPADQYPDVLLMVVECTKGSNKRAWRLIDRRTNDESAMSRTTGYTTAAVAMLLARKQFSEPGVHAPEKLGHHPELVKILLQDLGERGVKVENLLVTA